MEIYVLMAQRTERYEGEYAPEALACNSGIGHEDNPDYLQGEKAKADASGEFESTAIVCLTARGEDIMRILRPRHAAIPVTVTGGS